LTQQHTNPQSIQYARKPSNATLARIDPALSREAAAVEAARMVVSRAQGEYEALEKERKREYDGGDGDENDEERAAKRAKNGDDEVEEEEMEIEMEDDDDGKFKVAFTPALGSLA
jgi:hypothetical protein